MFFKLRRSSASREASERRSTILLDEALSPPSRPARTTLEGVVGAATPAPTPQYCGAHAGYLSNSTTSPIAAAAASSSLLRRVGDEREVTLERNSVTPLAAATAAVAAPRSNDEEMTDSEVLNERYEGRHDQPLHSRPPPQSAQRQMVKQRPPPPPTPSTVPKAASLPRDDSGRAAARPAATAPHNRSVSFADLSPEKSINKLHTHRAPHQPNAAAPIPYHEMVPFTDSAPSYQPPITPALAVRAPPRRALRSSADFIANPCGLFVSQSTLLAAFPTSEMIAALMLASSLSHPNDHNAVGNDNRNAQDAAAIRPGLVVTVECGGWLRVRDLLSSSTGPSGSTGATPVMSVASDVEGMVRYQCRLPHGAEASAACWTLAWSDHTMHKGHPSVNDKSSRNRGTLPAVRGVVLVLGLLGGGLACYRVTGESLMEIQTAAWSDVPVVQLCTLTDPSRTGLPNRVLSASAHGEAAVWVASVRGGLTCVAQTTLVATGDGGIAVTDAGLGGGGGFYANGVPQGFEEELMRGAGNGGTAGAFLIECPPPRAMSSGSGAADGDSAGGDVATSPEMWGVLQAYPASHADGGLISLVAPPRPPSAPDMMAPAVPSSTGRLWAGTRQGGLLVWDAASGVLLRRIRLPHASPVHALSSIAAHSAPTLANYTRHGNHHRGGKDSAMSDKSSSSSSTAFPFFLATMPEAVWACQLNGDVTVWEGDAFSLVQQLTISYPPRLQPKQWRRSTSASLGQGGGSGGVIVEDAVDLMRALRGGGTDESSNGTATVDGGRAAPHFTLRAAALEPVLMWRTWTMATDGTVRAWLVPATTTAAEPDNTDGTVEDDDIDGHEGDAESMSSSRLLDAEAVRLFVQAKAAELAAVRAQAVAEQEALASELEETRERNRALAVALKEATVQLQQRIAEEKECKSDDGREREEKGQEGGEGAAPSEHDAGNGGAQTETAPSAAVVGLMSTPPSNKLRGAEISTATDRGPYIDGSSTTRALSTDPTSNLARLLRSLQGKLDESLGERSAIQQELLAYRLRTLEDSAATHDARMQPQKEQRESQQSQQPREYVPQQYPQHHDPRRASRRPTHTRRSASPPSASSSTSLASSHTASASSEDLALVEAWSSTPLPLYGREGGSTDGGFPAHHRPQSHQQSQRRLRPSSREASGASPRVGNHLRGQPAPAQPTSVPQPFYRRPPSSALQGASPPRQDRSPSSSSARLAAYHDPVSFRFGNDSTILAPEQHLPSPYW